jgi:hypothetical protein
MKNVFSMLIAALIFAVSTPAAWVSQTITSNGDVGSGCAVITDTWGRPCVSYADKTNNRIVYARYNGSAWVFETAAAGIEILGETSLALDSAGRPGIVFADVASEEVKYASKSGSTWTVETIADGKSLGRLVTLAYSPNGPVAIYAVENSTNPTISYAYREAGVWKTENITAGVSGALCLDNDGTPHVVYTNVAGNSVCHRVRNGTTWSTGIVIGAGLDCDIAFGPDYDFHVSYAAPNNENLVYATSADGNVWSTEIVPTGEAKPAFTHVAVTSAGYKFISYFDFNTFGLCTAKRVGASWAYEIVATEGYVGNCNAITPNGPASYPYIAYYDNDPADMKLAYYNISNVNEKSFTARGRAGAIDLSWSTDGVENAAGYNLYRAPADDDAVGHTRLNSALITGRSPYHFQDEKVGADRSYFYWLEEVTATGAAETYGPVVGKVGSHPRAFALGQNYPNPGSDKTTITFSLPTAGDATLNVYDLTGRKVATAFEGPARAGENTVALPLAGLTPGVYTYRLEAEGTTATRKMVVAK